MAALIDTVLEIDTPDHLAFRTRIAGPGRRMLAWIIDTIIWVCMLAFVSRVLSLMFAIVDLGGLGMGLTLLVVFFVWWFYYFACEMLTGGRSPGKILLKLRVVKPKGAG